MVTLPTRVDLPKKLKNDSIVEALCELRFDAPAIPEIAVGRIMDKLASMGKPKRLPTADIPEPIREAAAQLRHQPWYELRHDDGPLIRVGPNLISCHRVGRYVGWERFEPEIAGTIRALYEAIDAPKVSRIGLRYVNALIPDLHLIKDVHDLLLQIRVANDGYRGPVLLTLLNENSEAHLTQTRIASPRFAAGVPGNACAIVEVDVSTPAEVSFADIGDVLKWVSAAHDFEKAAFFRLFPPDILQALKEE